MAKPFLVICRKFFHVFIVGCYIPVRVSIAVAIRSLDPTLGLLEAGAQGISIAVIIHSFDRTLQTVGNDVRVSMFTWRARYRGTTWTVDEYGNGGVSLTRVLS